MRLKNIVHAVVLSVFLLVLTFPFCRVSAASTLVTVDPLGTTVNAGEYFNVAVKVTDIVNFTSWQFRIFYLKSVLNCSAVAEGPFLKTGGGTYFGKNITNNYNGTHGWVLAYCTLLGMVSVSGSGAIATVTFRAMSGGSTPLHLDDVQLGDEKIPPKPIPYVSIDGTVQVIAGTTHDVTVTCVAPNKNITGKGNTCNVTVTTENHGGFPEIYDVTLHANETAIGTVQVTLQLGDVANISFVWNTSAYAYGGYVLHAYAWPVPGEISDWNNNCTGGQVQVLMPGDVQTPFRRVDMKDIAFLARRFILPPSDPLWDSNADINNDGRVDMKDIAVPARNFGISY